jgi:hypothetical protein
MQPQIEHRLDTDSIHQLSALPLCAGFPDGLSWKAVDSDPTVLIQFQYEAAIEIHLLQNPLSLLELSTIHFRNVEVILSQSRLDRDQRATVCEAPQRISVVVFSRKGVVRHTDAALFGPFHCFNRAAQA